MAETRFCSFRRSIEPRCRLVVALSMFPKGECTINFSRVSTGNSIFFVTNDQPASGLFDIVLCDVLAFFQLLCQDHTFDHRIVSAGQSRRSVVTISTKLLCLYPFKLSSFDRPKRFICFSCLQNRFPVG